MANENNDEEIRLRSAEILELTQPDEEYVDDIFFSLHKKRDNDVDRLIKTESPETSDQPGVEAESMKATGFSTFEMDSLTQTTSTTTTITAATTRINGAKETHEENQKTKPLKREGFGTSTNDDNTDKQKHPQGDGVVVILTPPALQRNTVSQPGALAVYGPHSQELDQQEEAGQNQEFEIENADGDETVAVVAAITVQDDEAERERRVRDRILGEAVQAEVMVTNPITSNSYFSEKEEESKKRKHLKQRYRQIIVGLILLSAALLGTIVGVIVFTLNRNDNQNHDKKKKNQDSKEKRNAEPRAPRPFIASTKPLATTPPPHSMEPTATTPPEPVATTPLTAMEATATTPLTTMGPTVTIAPTIQCSPGNGEKCNLWGQSRDYQMDGSGIMTTVNNGMRYQRNRRELMSTTPPEPNILRESTGHFRTHMLVVAASSMYPGHHRSSVLRGQTRQMP